MAVCLVVRDQCDGLVDRWTDRQTLHEVHFTANLLQMASTPHETKSTVCFPNL